MKKILLIIHTFSILSLNAFEIKPIENPDTWKQLTFSSIKANKLSFDKGVMKLSIEESASPLIYPFTKATALKKVEISGKVKGQLALKSEKQGAKGNDDFVFRLGLVLEGDQSLNFFQRTIAPEWITTLHALAEGKAEGIKHITFFNVVNDRRILGKGRTHPLNDLLKEKFITALNEDGSFNIRLDESNLPKEKILALWISSDGDDTSSSYTLSLDHFILTSR